MQSQKIINVNRLDAHDRFLHFTSAQSDDISKQCQKIIDSKPFGDNPFYIFAHARTSDDGFKKRLIWQPRLTKPLAQTNSMLFKVKPKSDIVEVRWLIPPREQWYLFEREMMTANEIVQKSIYMFKNHRKELEEKDEDDLPDERIDQIYREISQLAVKSKANK